MRLSLLAGLWLLFASFTATAQPLTIGDTVPDWTLRQADGSTVSFYQDASDKPVVLLFWATWCPYCRALMPELEALKQELNNEYPFYALNIFEDADPVAHVKARNYSFTLLLDADPVAKQYGVKGTPGVIVVGSDKKVRYIRKSGTKPAEVVAAVKAVLH